MIFGKTLMRSFFIHPVCVGASQTWYLWQTETRIHDFPPPRRAKRSGMEYSMNVLMATEVVGTFPMSTLICMVISGILLVAFPIVIGMYVKSRLDADVRDGVTEENLSRISREIMEFAGERHCMVIASGRIDIVTDGRIVYSVRNGDPMMAQITGSGCMSSALLGAYLGVEISVEAAASACAVMGICGEIAGAKTRAQGGGTMTFHQLLIDACSVLREEDVQTRILVREEK